MDQTFEYGFYNFVRNKAKEYVCHECGTYSLKATRRKYVNPREAEVMLRCEHCGFEKEVEMHMSD